MTVSSSSQPPSSNSPTKQRTLLVSEPLTHTHTAVVHTEHALVLLSLSRLLAVYTISCSGSKANYADCVGGCY